MSMINSTISLSTSIIRGGRMLRTILRLFDKLKELNDRVEILIEVVSLDFGWSLGWEVSTTIGRRLKLTADQAYPIYRVFNFLGYLPMKLLLAFAVTALFNIPLSLLILYFYIADEFEKKIIYLT